MIIIWVLLIGCVDRLFHQFDELDTRKWRSDASDLSAGYERERAASEYVRPQQTYFVGFCI